MIRNWTEIELNNQRTEAYSRYLDAVHRGAPRLTVSLRYRKYVRLDNMVRERQRNAAKPHVTSGFGV